MRSALQVPGDRRRRRLPLVIMVVALFATSLGALGTSSAVAGSFSVTPVADTYTRSDVPSGNFGTRQRLSARENSVQLRKSYLRFNVQLPTGTLVSRATLRLYAASNGTRAGVEVRGVADNSWEERALTHNNAPAVAPTVTARSSYYASGSYVSLDVTPLVEGSGLRSLALTTLSSTDHVFASREDLSHQPRLTIETAPAPVPGTVMFGVTAEGVPWDMSELDAFVGAAAKRPGLVMWYQDFAHFPDFDPALPQRVIDRGAVPMLTWEPWDYTGGTEQPNYSLTRIIDGAHDAQIRRWAAQIAAWNKPLYLRFAHEMNGNWNSWSEGVNGNLSGQYLVAWRHIWELFRQAGASNVTWVWSPNVVYSNSPPLAPFYPGDAYVDRVALDGYNWGNHFPHWQAWLSFEEIFGPGLAQLKALTAKPIMVAETASTEGGGDKAAWITDMFAALKNHPEIVAFTWFNHDKETDWRIQSSPAAQAAFAAGVSDSRYMAATP